MTIKLTAANVRKLRGPHAGKTEVSYTDAEIPGFYLRVRNTGARTLTFQYFRQGASNKTPKIKIGEVGAIDFGEARKIARKYYARVQLGEDPAADRAEARVKASETFAATATRFLAHQRTRLRARSYVDLERHILKHAKVLHPMPIEKIARRDIATLIAAVADESGLPTGNRVRTSLGTFFSWAIAQGLVEGNPVIGTQKNQERSRDRVLSPAELRVIWNNLAHDHYGSILRLLALTGQRAAEIAGLRWSEVNLDDGIIALPGERTKNHRPHFIPLSAPARAIIEAQPRRATVVGLPRDLIFGIGEGAFSGWSNSKEGLNERIEKATGAPLPQWQPHDLRRSFATHAAEIGIQPHIIEAILNHISGHRAGVAGIYNRAAYEREKRVALDRWAEHLLAVVDDRASNIVTLPQLA
jgi:integrase